MLKRTVFLAAILLAILGFALPPVTLAQDSAPTTSSLLVKLVSGLTTQQQSDVIARNGGTEVSTIPALRLHVIAVPAADLTATLASYQADPQVVSAEENKVRQSEAVPLDPLYSNQWALPQISWDLAFGTILPTGSATVAVLDTGIDASHPDLWGKVVSGTSILNGSDGLTDPSGHGTWMAGIIAARTNTVGIAGVAYEGVRIMPVTVLDANGLGQDSDVIMGILWAADHGADVILMAFSNAGFSQNLQDAIDYAWSRGVVLVAAVGNDSSSDPTFPAGDRGVMGVSATDATDNLASFSNNGLAVFLAAPGIDILTTNIGGTYGLLSGTSTSAAIVAGAAAQVKAVDPTLTNGVIVGRLARTADPAGTQAQTGNGRINLARALEDTGTDFIEPTGAAPVGGGGPFVGPYRAAALNLNSVSVGSQVGSLAAGIAGSVTFAVTVHPTGSGSLFVSLSVSGLPTGATGTFSSSCLTFSSSTDQTPTLTITTTAATPAAATTFTVTGTEKSAAACSGSTGTSKSGNGTLTIAKGTPTITFGAAPTPTYLGGNFTVSATTSNTDSSTLTYSRVSGPCALVSGSTFSSSGAGSCVVRASGAATTNFNAASADQSVTIAQATQAISFAALTGKTYGAPDFSVSATGGASGNAVTFAAAGSCTVTGSTVHLTGAGSCTITASQAGNTNYSAATDVAQTFAIAQATQAISFAALADMHVGDADFPVSATGGASGQPVTFTAAGSCTVTGSTVHITGVGSCTITAHQAGDTNYSAAPDVPQSFTIIDNTPPDTSVDSGPTSPTNATTASFTFSGTDNVTPAGSLTFECQLDSGGFSACTSSKTYNGLTDGPHTFYVRAIDAAGNVDPTAASFNWSVDTAPPDTILDSMPSSLTNQTTATFAFHATESSSTLECSLDGVAFTACTSPVSYLGLTDGPHTFDVRAKDAAGNVDPTAASFTWTVDTLAPDTLIDSYPADPTNSNTATFTFHASEGSTFSCQLDAGSAAACNSGTVTYPGLGAGPHTFTVTATDAAGNTDPSAASFTWTIDVTLPDTSITGGPTEGSTTTSISATFDFTGTDNLTLPADLTFECSLDGAAFGPCTSPTSYSTLSRDSHTFAVRAKDAAGNRDASPASVTWTITKITPVITWTNPADITYPTPLSGTQLNAIADVAGSFVYAPASGTVLTAGDNQDLMVTFTPSDTTNYSTVSKTVKINVKQSDQTITVTTAALATATYNSTFPVAATASSSLAVEITTTGVCSGSGSNSATITMTSGTGTCTVHYNQIGNSNYKPATEVTNGTTAATAAVTATAGSGSAPYDGAAKSPSACAVTGAYTGDLTCANSPASVGPDAGTTTIVPVVSGTGLTNFTVTPVNGSYTISQVSSTTVVSCTVGAPYTYTGAAQTPCTVSVTGVNLSLTPLPTYLNNVNAGTATASYTYDGDLNHTGSSHSTTFAIAQATQAISFAALADMHVGDADFPVSATGGASGQPVTFTAAGSCTVTGSTVHITGVGSCTITAHQAGDTNYSAAPDVPQSFTITDNTPPDTSVLTGPTSPTNATTASFTFSGTDNVTPAGSLTFECQLDSGGFSVCTSSKTYTSLLEGPHTFYVRAIDAAGNTDPLPATFNWTIDLTPGTAVIDSHPDALTNSGFADFAFHATEVNSTLACQLDGEPVTNCTVGTANYSVGEGAHTFTVTATDAAGNVDPTPPSFAWTVDQTAPNTLILSHPDPITNSNSPSFTFEATEGSTFVCQLDAVPAAACNSGEATYSGLGAGSHTFTVTATDAAGNTDSSPASFTWTIDVTPPDTSITGGPADGSSTTTTSASFDFEGTDNLTLPVNLTFECSLDGAPFAGCTSPTSFLGLSRDTHAFRVQAKDAAGNTDASPATRTWTITKMTPVITWANPADITYPTPLSGTQLNAIADVAGSFVYTPASGTVLTAGDNQDLTVTFTPTDTTNYSTLSKTVHINVKKATPTVSVTWASYTYDSTAHAASGFAYGVGGVGDVLIPAVTFSYAGTGGTVYWPSASAPSGAGTYTVTASFAGNTNYTIASNTAGITISKADPVVTATGNTCTYNGSPCAGSGSATGVGGVILTPVTVAYKDALNTLLTSAPVNAGTYSVAARYAGNANYNQKQSAPATITISPASSTTTVSCPASVTYTGAAQTPCTATVTGVGGLNSSLTVSYINNVNAGTATASASFVGDANYTGSSGSASFTIAKQTLTIAASPQSKQYSDPLPPFTVTYSGFVPGEGPGNLGGSLICTTTATATSGPGTYPITCSGLTSGNYAFNYVPGTLTVNQEDARVSYTGAFFASTSSTTSSSATVTLAATVQDITASTGDPATDSYPGDIRNARVRFVNRDAFNAVLCDNVPVGLVNSADTRVGTATCNWNVNITGDSQSFTVGIITYNYYTRDRSEDDSVVTVSKPLNNFITGGGHLLLANSAGQKAGDSGTKNNGDRSRRGLHLPTARCGRKRPTTGRLTQAVPGDG